MTSGTRSIADTNLGALGRRAAERAIGELGRRLAVGELTVEMPDGSRLSFRGTQPGPSGEIRLHDVQAAWRIVLGGEIGAGEAFMDGSWDSPDLVATLMVAALNRDSLAVTSGWLRKPTADPAHDCSSGAAQHRHRQSPEHHGALRPRQRFLSAVSGRDDDVLVRRL